ncbi:MAG: bifunctional diaminohydroxyphosphoribosylaminopyrimidine deaminase/5-amino-6-(5-phosphoribosylamino)uracil reductase RibD [Acidobacteriia bacterium]|jgi:diaminohydroxyphosphoribosylaminopyrimidine deaminase/5-amino-6-(5-phosphoribosylamino)uracil reductase|nr:bifunctional diaminohydroxyphosphoribosylaminopyrimidine deaminase/5-amino-6-(5-phosphoribosylamino)uracil reductase RibD [Terriglobia bacterium]
MPPASANPPAVSDDDARWMDRALELARRGEALASPNPMVGAVIVADGRVVGEAFHTYDGVRHAEVLALEAAGAAARGATLYVNLEPCCHTGRTPPCTEALLRAGIARVVAAMADPNPAVHGRGLRQLRRAGLAVTTGPRAAEARKLNEAFACWIRTGRPLVTMKSALSLDARIAHSRAHRRRRRWITGAAARAEVQQLRHAADAVLTGIGTVLADDPLLTDRTGQPRRRRLLRVVLDSRLRLPLDSRLVRSVRSDATGTGSDLLVFTTADADTRRARALVRAGVELVRVRSRGGRVDLNAVLEELGRRQILSVLLEAGAELGSAALAAGIVDRLVLYYAQKLLGAEAVPWVVLPARQLRRLPPLRQVTLRTLGPDFVLEGYFRDVYRNH